LLLRNAYDIIASVNRKTSFRFILLALLAFQIWVPAGDAMSCPTCINFHLNNFNAPASDIGSMNSEMQQSPFANKGDLCPDGVECCLVCANVYAPSPSSYQIVPCSLMFDSEEPIFTISTGPISSIFRPPKTI